MWIVKVAYEDLTVHHAGGVDRPHGRLRILRTPTDIFPNIKIPITAVIWRYSGILPEELQPHRSLFRTHHANHRKRREHTERNR